MKTIIHVNQGIIRDNTKTGESNPALTVKTYKSLQNAHSADICDKDGNVVARVVHSPHKPLSCGARIWIESEYEVITHTEEQK